MSRRAKRYLLISGLLSVVSTAQTPDAGTRAEEIAAQQRAKAQDIKPDAPERPERIFNMVEKLSDRFFGIRSGFRPIIGNMVTGSGFAAGVEYFRPDLNRGNILFRSSARASIRKYEVFDAQFALPHLASDRAFVDVYGAYRNYPSLTFYGSGPRSLKSGSSRYRMEDVSFDGSAGVKPFRRLRLGLTIGYLRVNVGRGTSDRFASSENVYSEAEAPGIQQQSDFLRGGAFLDFDYRDRRGDPHRGGNVSASYIYYNDLRLNTANHRKLNAQAHQYFSFFNEKRVLAFRGRTELSYRNTNQVVPFYLQPELGGADDLRGFRPFRFYDNNLLLMSAEYRWEIMTGFDVALFNDWGKVFHRHAELNFADLESSAGFGFRFKSRDAVFMRWDVGFSREGFQVWIKFNNGF
jgi:outer membrane protein assembly factor BamA